MTKLFIDDLRDPPNQGWIVKRNYNDAVKFIEQNGIPEIISFDHDLGEEMSGYDVAKRIVGLVINGDAELPEEFSYNVHSANPVGKKNIEYLLDNFTKYVAKQNGD